MNTCLQSVRGGYVAPAAEQEGRPLVRYEPIGHAIVVGYRAWVIPLDHYANDRVSNTGPAFTGTVVAYDETTGAFETRRTRYVLADRRH